MVFYSVGDGPDKGTYYDAHPIEHKRHHLTMVACGMNERPRSFGHGTPLWLRNDPVECHTRPSPSGEASSVGRRDDR